MRRKDFSRGNRDGLTLAELSVAMAAMVLLLAVVASASITLKKGIEGTTRYVADFNNGNRVIDYVAQDLRRAVRVGQLVGGTNTPFKTGTQFPVTETSTLTINVPDYYASNTPDRTLHSSFKTPRNVLGTPVTWTDAVNATTLTVRYAPATAATDEIQVRYYRATRSVSSAVSCYYRGGYSATAGTALATPVEIAESVVNATSTTELLVSGFDAGQRFQVQSDFTTRFRLSGGLAAATTQVVEVTLHNPRRD